MNPYVKSVGQIASIFGVIFVVFAAFAAIVNYIGLSQQAQAYLSVGLLEYYLLNAMLPFLLLAALSFTVAAVLNRASRNGGAEEPKPAEELAEPKPQSEESPVP
jgi:large-conductance mechanosensitive channel